LVTAGGLMSALHVAAAELKLRYQNRLRVAALESRGFADVHSHCEKRQCAAPLNRNFLEMIR
jgi:hypothetical protein